MKTFVLLSMLILSLNLFSQTSNERYQSYVNKCNTVESITPRITEKLLLLKPEFQTQIILLLLFGILYGIITHHLFTLSEMKFILYQQIMIKIFIVGCLGIKQLS